MPKPINPHCVACAALSSKEARAKACWDKTRCHKRRSFYRSRLAEPPATSLPQVRVLEVPLPETVYAILYRYLTPTGLLHAVGAELYRGSELIAKTKPLHVGALTEAVLKQYLQSVLTTFSDYGESSVVRFREMIDLPLERHGCPVERCQLH